MEAAELTRGLLWFAAFLFSTTVHEAAHALVALRGGDLLSVLLVLNVLLFVFNMLPLPPLDGASAIGGVLPERTVFAVRGFVVSPAFSFLGIFIAWQLFPHVADPLFAALLKIVHPAEIYGD